MWNQPFSWLKTCTNIDWHGVNLLVPNLVIGDFFRYSILSGVHLTENREGLQKLLETIYLDRGLDFREYRESTLTRRIGRRLRATGSESYEEYAGLLTRKPHEYEKLFDDLTINVTRFFRDKPAFTALEAVVFPELIQGTGKENDLRIWSAGCSTGEEAYSVAILLLEFLRVEAMGRRIRILGSDIDPKALDRARDGFFPNDHGERLQTEWRKRYFFEEDGGIRVKPDLKKFVDFEAHNVLEAPPWTDQDLVLCRNLLIYFTPALQVRALKNLHKGLRKGGFLFLGKAEIPVREAGKLFHCVDRKAKLYRKA